ncbi:MAG: bifunctional DNA primase/polymerase [Planctomycetes bacterium]|nr:bifunctional DNA primase/polymerase [Planctomycetota bacterium]
MTRDDLAYSVEFGHGLDWSFTPLDGKKPILKDWPTLPRATLEKTLEWAKRYNIGLRTGRISFIVVIDVDMGADTDDLHLPDTVAVKSGGGGVHLYYRCTLPLGNSVGGLGPHVDVRADAGQVVYPGSRHPETGEAYEWLPGHAPWEIDVAGLPAEIYQRLAKPEPKTDTNLAPRRRTRTPGYADAALQAEVKAVALAPVGARNHTLNRAAFNLGQLVGGGALDRGTVESELRQAAASAELQAREVEATIRSGIEAGAKEPRTAPERTSAHEQPSRDGEGIGTGPKKRTRKRKKTSTRQLDVSHNLHALNDTYNAEIFVEDHGEDVHYVQAWKSWLVWTGRRWERDQLGDIYRRTKRTVRSLNNLAAKITDDSVYQAYMKFIKQSGQAHRIAGMLKCAQGEEGVSVMPSELDADPYLFNVLNGTLDLRAGTLREHRREDLITKLAPVEYDPDAHSTVLDNFLFTASGEDLQMLNFLCRAAGSALVAGDPDEKLFFLYGRAATGKSTFLDAVQAAMGDYARTADFNSFLRTREPRSHTAGLAPLVGARFVSSCEVEDGKRLAEGVLNTMAGGDRITIRDVYEKAYEIKPSWKLFLSANVKPRLTDDERNGIWRRILLVPFDVQIPEAERDPAVKRALSDPRVSGPAVLAWLVKGCLAWQMDGLQVPETVKAATVTYRREQNPLTDFFEQCCILGPGYSVRASALYDAYRRWAGKGAPSQRWFGLRLEKEGLQRGKSDGRVTYRSIGLLAE